MHQESRPAIIDSEFLTSWLERRLVYINDMIAKYDKAFNLLKFAESSLPSDPLYYPTSLSEGRLKEVIHEYRVRLEPWNFQLDLTQSLNLNLNVYKLLLSQGDEGEEVKKTREALYALLVEQFRKCELFSLFENTGESSIEKAGAHFPHDGGDDFTDLDYLIEMQPGNVLQSNTEVEAGIFDKNIEKPKQKELWEYFEKDNQAEAQELSEDPKMKIAILSLLRLRGLEVSVLAQERLGLKIPEKNLRVSINELGPKSKVTYKNMPSFPDKKGMMIQFLNTSVSELQNGLQRDKQYGGRSSNHSRSVATFLNGLGTVYSINEDYNSAELNEWVKLIKAFYNQGQRGKYKNIDSEKMLRMLEEGVYVEGRGIIIEDDVVSESILKSGEPQVFAAPEVSFEDISEKADQWERRFNLIRNVEFQQGNRSFRVDFLRNEMKCALRTGKIGQPRKLRVEEVYENIRNRVFEVKTESIPLGFWKEEEPPQEVVAVVSSVVEAPHSQAVNPKVVSNGIFPQGHPFYGLDFSQFEVVEKQNITPSFSRNEIYQYAYIYDYKNRNFVINNESFSLNSIEYVPQYDSIFILLKSDNQKKIFRLNDFYIELELQGIVLKDQSQEDKERSVMLKNLMDNRDLGRSISLKVKKAFVSALFTFFNHRDNEVWIAPAMIRDNNNKKREDKLVTRPVKEFSLHNVTDDFKFYFKIGEKSYDRIDMNIFFLLLDRKQIQLMKLFKSKLTNEKNTIANRVFSDVLVLGYHEKPRGRGGQKEKIYIFE